MINASHPRHGEFLSELRSLGFTTTVRPTVTGGRGHVAIIRNHTQHLIVIPPSASYPGMILDLDQNNRLLWANWAVPAECFSDAVRDRAAGVEATRMHGPDCTCTHPDGQ
jgi:hypothetical protein